MSKLKKIRKSAWGACQCVHATCCRTKQPHTSNGSGLRCKIGANIFNPELFRYRPLAQRDWVWGRGEHLPAVAQCFVAMFLGKPVVFRRGMLDDHSSISNAITRCCPTRTVRLERWRSSGFFSICLGHEVRPPPGHI